MRNIIRFGFLAGLLTALPRVATAGEFTLVHEIPAYHVYQNAFRKLGLAGLIYCGPAAATESLAFLKWTRKPNFPLLKWAGESPMGPTAPSDAYLYSQTLALADLFKTTPWLFPIFDPLYTDPVNMVKGLRTYFKDSGYSNPWVFIRGFRAFDAPEGKTLEEMRRGVTLEEIRGFTEKGYGVILLVGYYFRVNRSKLRNGGHYLTVFGYTHDPAWGDGRTDFVVTDSVLKTEKQPRRISVTAIQKNPDWFYPDHVNFKIDGDDSVYLDSAIIFIPEK